MNSIGYRTKRIVIDSDTLKTLKSMESRRRIVSSQVNRLKKNLLEGGHFDSPLVVNKKDEKLVLIDGNHRFEAIKQWIEENASNKIMVEFAIYENLDDAGEKEIFTRWNSGRKQSSNDFVQMYANEISVLQKMLSNFPTPVRIYSLQEGQKGVHFSSLLKSYFMSRVPFPEFRPYMGSAKKFVDDCVSLRDEDYENLKDFVKFFEQVFGHMEKDNSYNTTTMLNCIMTVYFDNIEELGEDTLIRLFRRHMLGNPRALILGTSGGRAATENLYNQLRAEFSRGRSRNVLRLRNLGEAIRTEEANATVSLPSI